MRGSSSARPGRDRAASSTRARNAASTSAAPVRVEQPVQGVVGEQPPVAQEQQAVAVRGLVHHVAAHEQGRAAVGEVAEQLPTGRDAAPGRDRRSARRAPAARARRAGPRRATPEPPGRRRAGRPRRRRGCRGRPRRPPGRRRSGARRARPRSSAGSRARSGRRRPTAPGSRSRPGGAARGDPAGRPSTCTLAARDDLDAHQRAHQGALAAAAGAEQPGHGAARRPRGSRRPAPAGRRGPPAARAARSPDPSWPLFITQ